MTEPPPAVLLTRELVPEAMRALEGRCAPDVYTGPPDAIPRAEFLRRAEGRHGLLVMLTERVDRELLDAAGPDLRVVANHAVGHDNIDVAECTRRGVLVTNTPDVLTESTADLTWALILASVRRIAGGDRFPRPRAPWVRGPRMVLGQDLHGKVLGIVGCGRVGQEVARRARGFGMHVVYTAPRRLPAQREAELGVRRRDLGQLLTEADVVSVHAPLTPMTRHLFNDETFAMMKPTAVLVNTARGPIVDEKALARAVENAVIFAAGLDEFEREPDVEESLLALDSVTVAPHLGGTTTRTRAAMGLLAVENLLAGVSGRRPRTPVNHHRLPVSRSGSPQS